MVVPSDTAIFVLKTCQLSLSSLRSSFSADASIDEENTGGKEETGTGNEEGEGNRMRGDEDEGEERCEHEIKERGRRIARYFLQT